MDLQGLSSICAGLGIVEEDEDGNRIGYSKGAYCLDNLKDLLRFLRRDDPQTREVFKQVCKWNCVSKDLIPIIEHCREDRGLTLNSVKVLVFLTMPIEPMSSDIPQQIEYLWSLKSAITLSDTVAIIVSLLESPLENLESNAFTEDDWKLVQLVLTLFRNLLAIQDVSVFQKAAGSATQILSLRDRFLELLFRDSVMDLILIVTQHVSESSAYIHQDNWLLLEIFYYIFSGQDPELVARVHAKSVEDAETKASLNSLKSIIEEEKDKKRLSRLQSGACHSHFSGTFERLTMDGSKAVFKGNPHSASCDISIKPDKNYGGMRKKIVWDEGRLSTTTNTILKSLHDFVNQFLSGGYNVLVQSIRADIERENLNIQRSDIIYLFEVAKFVTSFQYHKFLTSKPSVEMDSSIPSDYYRESTQFQGSICGPIAASMNESMFLTVISKWRDAFDGLKETKEYKFLSVAGSTLKAMIRILDLVLKLLPEDSREPQTARVLLYKLFYDQTDQGMTHFLLNLIKSFDIHKQPKSDLADLVEVMHTVVELMERLQDRGTLRVSRKSRKVKKVNRLGDKAKIGREPSSDQHAVPNESGISDGEQLVNGDLHPEDGQFSADGNSGEKAVPLAGDKEKPDVSTTEGQNANNNVTCLCKSDHPKSSGYSSGDSSDDEQFVQYNEVDFRISTLLSAFANNGIIHNLCWLLKFYKSNCIDTNHYIISILRRITDDLELSPMLYQLSLLIVFHGILVEQKARPNMEYTEISEFLTNLVRKMLRKMKHQPLLFVEVLFWKTRKECQYIDAEYLLHEVGKLKKQFGYVENVSMMGEIGPTHATGWVSRSIADALGEDEADVVISHDLGNDEEFNESDIAAVPNLGMNGKANIECGSSLEHDYGEVSKRKGRLVLSHELDSKIRDLYAKFQNDKKCHQMIAEALDPHGKISAAQVGNKLKQLGLKISRRKRRPSDEPSSPVQFGKGGGEGEDAQERENLSQTHDFIHSLPRQPSHARKRVRALSEDQEGAIRTLFEKFKNHKRCSYMISNALDGDRIFTPAQIARKLKQLGLRVSRPKKDEGTLHLRNENLSNLPADKMQDSDDETLLSLRLRKRNLYDEGWFSSKLQNADSKGKSSEDDSDDETLSSVLKRSRKVTPLLKTKSFEDKNPRKNSTETTLLERDADDVTVGNATEGDQQNRPLHIEATGSQRTAQVNNLSFRASEVETTGNNLVEDLGSPTKEAADAPLEEVYDDLADSGDDLPPDVMARKKPVTGRRLRVVFDLEDDY